MSYVTLFSNASMDKFPENTTASYCVELDVPKNVEDAEVSLAEISFPTDYQKQYRIATYSYGIATQKRARKFHFKFGEYDSLYDLYISLERDNPDAKVSCFPKNRSMSISVPHNEVTAKLRPETDVGHSSSLHRGELFGSLIRKETSEELVAFRFPNTNSTLWNYFFTEGIIHLNFRVRHDPTIDFVYVHCNIIEPQEDSGKLVPLLRVVQVNDRKSFSKYYTKPFYFPVNINRLGRIEISLLDDKGGKIPFRSSPSSAVLHFRRRGVAL